MDDEEATLLPGAGVARGETGGESADRTWMMDEPESPQPVVPPPRGPGRTEVIEETEMAAMAVRAVERERDFHRAPTEMPKPKDPLPPAVPGRSFSDALAAGYMLQWYRIEKVLGQGGFGITYKALDTRLNTHVAIKEYLPSQLAVRQEDCTVHPRSPETREYFEKLRRGFLDEARTLAQFRHPNLVRVLTFFEQGNTACIAMEYEEGEGLNAILSRQKTLSEAELRELLLPLLDGVRSLHQAGFIHRDIKPENIFIRKRDRTPVLLDFGSARKALDQGHMTALLTPSFAPLEQYYDDASQQGPWSDLYALGAVMYQSVTGSRPVAALQRQGFLMQGMPDPLMSVEKAAGPGYSEALLKGIDWAMGLMRNQRPQSVDEWLAALRPALGSVTMPAPASAPAPAAVPVPVTAPEPAAVSPPVVVLRKEDRVEEPESPAAAATGRGGMSPLVVGLAALGVLGMLGGVGWWWQQRAEETASPPKGKVIHSMPIGSTEGSPPEPPVAVTPPPAPPVAVTTPPPAPPVAVTPPPAPPVAVTPPPAPPVAVTPPPAPPIAVTPPPAPPSVAELPSTTVSPAVTAPPAPVVSSPAAPVPQVGRPPGALPTRERGESPVRSEAGMPKILKSLQDVPDQRSAPPPSMMPNFKGHQPSDAFDSSRGGLPPVPKRPREAGESSGR